MKRNGTKLKGDWKVEFKKLLELDRKVSFKVLTQFRSNFGHLEWTKVNKMKPGWYCIKNPESCFDIVFRSKFDSFVALRS